MEHNTLQGTCSGLRVTSSEWYESGVKVEEKEKEVVEKEAECFEVVNSVQYGADIVSI